MTPADQYLVEARKFLEVMFGDKGDDLNINLWRLPDKQGKCFKDLQAAAEYAVGCRAKFDVYYSVGLSRQSISRFKVSDIDCLTAFWMDIDIGKASDHAKQNYPPDEAAADKILSYLPQATMVVHSGHGYHVLWRFKEPWILDSLDEQRHAALCARAWGFKIRDVARAKGWIVDSVHDLSRVLRIPGTMNYKDPKYNREVTLIRLKDPAIHYELDDFLEDYEIKDADVKEKPKDGDIVVSPDADPPFKKFHAMYVNDAKFKQSYDRKRKDLADSSASGYDMALASLVARAGWERQEIVNLLIAARRKHGDSLKLREDYYARTVPGPSKPHS